MGAFIPKAQVRSRYERFGALGEFDIEVVRKGFSEGLTSLPKVGAGGKFGSVVAGGIGVSRGGQRALLEA